MTITISKFTDFYTDDSVLVVLNHVLRIFTLKNYKGKRVIIEFINGTKIEVKGDIDEISKTFSNL